MYVNNIILENLETKPNSFAITLDKPGVFYYIVYGFRDTEKKIEVHIESPEVEAHILGLCIGTTGKCGIETFQHHAAPNSMSNLHIKSVLGGDASLSYRGMIRIDKHAQQSNAYQQNDNLLVSSDAHIDTKPELEIIANDVKCSHGATIGQLNEEQLYYMQTRGIQKKEAATLALHGFAQDIVNKLPDKYIQTRLQDYVLEQLQHII